MDNRPNHPTTTNVATAGDAQPPAIETRHLRNHLLWLGPLITFGGAVSYFLFFARFPALRDFPWVNFPLVLGGLILSFVGLRRAFDKASAYRGKWLGWLGTLFSLLVGGMFGWYVFYYSYSVPPVSAKTAGLEFAPEFELVDQEGRHVRLSDFRGRKVVLVFYRGFW